MKIKDYLNDDLSMNLYNIIESKRVKEVATQLKATTKAKITRLYNDNDFINKIITSLKDKLYNLYRSNLLTLKSIERKFFKLSDMDIIEYFDKNWFNEETRTYEHGDYLKGKFKALVDNYGNIKQNALRAVVRSTLKIEIEHSLQKYKDLLREYNLNIEVFSSLDDINIALYPKNTLYLIQSNATDGDNFYDEYCWDYASKNWIKLEQEKIDFDSYVKQIQDILAEYIKFKGYENQNQQLYKHQDYVLNDTIVGQNTDNISYNKNGSNKEHVINYTISDYRSSNAMYDDTAYQYYDSNVKHILSKDLIAYGDNYLYIVDSALKEHFYSPTGQTCINIDNTSNGIFYIYHIICNNLYIDDTLSDTHLMIDMHSFNYLTEVAPSDLIYYVDADEYIQIIDSLVWTKGSEESADIVSKSSYIESEELIEFGASKNGAYIHASTPYLFNTNLTKYTPTTHTVKNRLVGFKYNGTNTYSTFESVDGSTKDVVINNDALNDIDTSCLDRVEVSGSVRPQLNAITKTAFHNNNNYPIYTYTTDNEVNKIKLWYTSDRYYYTTKNLTKISGNRARTILSVASNDGVTLAQNLCIDTFLYPKQIVRQTNALVAKNNVALEANVPYVINLDITRNASNNYAIYGELLDDPSTDGFDDSVRITINDEIVQVVDNTFNWEFEINKHQRQNDAYKITIISSQKLQLCYRVELFNGITNHSLARLFMESYGYYNINTKNDLDYYTLRSYWNTDVAIKVTNNVISFNSGLGKTRYSYNLGKFVDQVNDYLNAYNVVCQNVSDVNYINDNTITIKLKNHNKNLDYLVAEHQQKNIYKINIEDNSKVVSTTLLIDELYIDDDCLTCKAVADEITIPFVKKLKWQNKVKLIKDNAKSTNEYTSNDLVIANYQENNGKIKYITSYVDLKDYNPEIDHYHEEFNTDLISMDENKQLGKVFKTINLYTQNHGGNEDNPAYKYPIYNAGFIGNYPQISDTESLTGNNILLKHTTSEVCLSDYFAGKYLSKNRVDLIIKNDMAFSIIIFLSYKTDYSDHTITEFMSLSPNQSKVLRNIYGYIWYIYKYGEMPKYTHEENSSWTIPKSA